MPTIGNTYLGLLDLYKQTDRDGNAVPVLEILAQSNNMISDAVVAECNQGAEHLTTVRAGLPEGTWRRLYQGVQPTKGTTVQVKDGTGVLHAWSELDAELVEIARNPAAFRLNEARAKVHGLSQQMATALLYGDASLQPERFTGLAPRFNDFAAGNGGQLVHGGGTSGNTMASIWMITWGENSVHMLYPEGTKAGLSREDKGKTTRETQEGLYDVYREKFVWHAGLTVRDWRGVSAVRNIDVTALTATAASGADLTDLMVDMYYKHDNPGQPGGKTVIYASKTIATFLHKQAARRANVNLTLDNFEGRPILNFLGIPIRREDALLETEAVVPNY